MASSSTTCKLEHEVFLSFRGEDTRNSFTSHLHEALCQKKVNTFIDDELIRGDQISPSLLKAIEESKISVIIFSKEYASSRCCLLELEKILECNNKYDQIVLPVFYHVDPSDVRKQTGNFGTAFAQLEKRFKDDSEVLQRWRTALNEAGSLSGIVSKEFRNEASLVKDIVEHILKRLNDESSVIHAKILVGLDLTVKEIENLLCRIGVCNLGIWGIGGIGKTTLATAIFNKISRQFEASCFIENIREESEKRGGLNDMRQRLFYKCLGDKHPNVESSFSSKRLGRKKVLIVFDDVTDLKQLQHLTGVFDYLDPKSRIIITTRDKHLLKTCRVDHIHEMKGLSSDDAFQLFTLYAFEAKCPEDYIELSSRAIAYAKGVPLALEVLGSSLYKRTKKEWESYIKRLSRIPDMNIQKVLKVSYDGLNDEEQEVFLDIACFFKGYDRDLIEATLDGCGFASHYDINVLIERSLITASSNTITMHDLLQDMGREIVRQESIDDPDRCSRLWDHEDILKVLIKNKETEVIRSMRLDMSKVSESHLKLEDFKNMQNLKFLKVYGCKHDEEVPGLEVLESDSCLLCLNIFKPYFERFLWKFFEKNSSEHEKKLYGFEVLKSAFYELRYLLWDGYPANSLPPKFDPRNLVVLDMPYSKLKQLWNGDLEQNLVNLKRMDLSYSKHLCRMPDLSLFPNLESLILAGCRNLRNIFSSIHNLDKLVFLNLQECKNMDMLSISPQCRSLRTVLLHGCSNLKTFSYIPSTVEELYLDGTAIEELPSLEHLSRLQLLSLENCSELKNLPESIRGCKSLEYLSLSNSSKLYRLPKGLGNFSNLTRLDLSDCQRLKSLLELPCQLRFLDAWGCISLEELSSLPTSGVGMWDWVNLYFNSCYILKLHAKALLNIQSDAVLWFHNKEKESNMLEEQEEQDIHSFINGNRLVRGTLFYPGSEILDWFDLRSSENFIKLPKGCLNDNVIGFALCVVLSSPCKSLDLEKCRLSVGFDLFVDEKLIFRALLHNDDTNYHVSKSGLDYVYIGFEYQVLSELLPLSSNSEGCVEFSVDDKSLPFKLKKCGARLLYAEDNDLRTDARVDRD